MSDRLEARKERKAQNDAYLARIKELAENDDRIELDLGGTTVSSTCLLYTSPSPRDGW